MKHAGLDASMKETAICVVDETRKVVKEGNVGPEPETIAVWLQTGRRYRSATQSGRFHSLRANLAGKAARQ